VVDDFIERLLVTATLNANPAINEARRRVPKAGLKCHVAALVCEACRRRPAEKSPGRRKSPPPSRLAIPMFAGIQDGRRLAASTNSGEIGARRKGLS
jgi:hypothetical protein